MLLSEVIHEEFHLPLIFTTKRLHHANFTRSFDQIVTQSPGVIPMTERVKGNLLKYEVPVLAGNNDFKKKAKLATNSSAPAESLTRDTLNSILPPREFRENNEDLIQYVSTTPAAKSDMVKLQQQLDAALQQREARETGLCPIRVVWSMF
jgi:hypothetical protein